MGFKSVRKNTNTEDLPPLADPVRAKDLKKGESIQGYFIGTSVKDGKYGTNYNAILENPKTGERFILFSVGTLKYDLMDERLERGLLTKVTALGTEERTNQSTGDTYQISSFEVMQDPDKAIDLTEADELYKSNSQKKADKRAAVAEDVKNVVGG